MQNASPAPQSLPGRQTKDQTVRKKPLTTASATDLLEQRLAYSVDEAATVTGLSRDLLYDQMRIGKLGYLKIGRRRIITREHLAAFLALQSARASPLRAELSPARRPPVIPSDSLTDRPSTLQPPRRERVFQRSQAGFDVFVLVGAGPGSDHGCQWSGQSDRDVIGDPVDAQELAAERLWRSAVVRDAHEPVVAAGRFVCQVFDWKTGLLAQFRMPNLPSVFLAALADAHGDVVGADVGREVVQDDDWAACISGEGRRWVIEPGSLPGCLGMDVSGIGDGDAGLESKFGALAREERIEVAGDGTTGHEVGRADDVEYLPGGDLGSPHYLPDGFNDGGGPERRPGALPVGVAVDQADGHGRDLAALGSQGHLTGGGEPCLGVVRAGWRVAAAAAKVALAFDQRDRQLPWQRHVGEHLVGVTAGEPDLVFEGEQ